MVEIVFGSVIAAVAIIGAIAYTRQASAILAGATDALSLERESHIEDVARVREDGEAALNRERLRSAALQSIVAGQQRTLMEAFAKRKPTEAAAKEALYDVEAISRLNGLQNGRTEESSSPAHNQMD